MARGSFSLWLISATAIELSSSKGSALIQGFPGGSAAKQSACNAGDPGSTPESGRCPGEGNGNPLQYSCLENAMDGGAWGGYSPRGRKGSDKT